MTLKTRINIIAVLVTLAVAVTLVAAGELSVREKNHQLEEARISGVSTLWKKITKAQFQQMLAGSKALARDRDTLAAIKAGDQEEISDSGLSSYNLLSTQGILDHLTILDKQGHTLYSSRENPASSTANSIAQRVLAEKKSLTGIEADRDGQLVATVAFPLYSRGKPLGVGVYEKFLQSALEDLKQNSDAEASIVSNNGIMQSSTDSELFEQLTPGRILEGQARNDIIELDDNRIFSVVTYPIKSSDDTHIGYLLASADVTSNHQRLKNIELTAFGLAGATLLIALLGLSFYLRRAFQPISDVVAIVNQVAEGNLEELPKPHPKNDETGQLVKAVTRMHEMLHRIVADVRDGASEIANVSAEMAENNTALAQRTETQASNLEKTSSSMEEFTAAGRHNAEHTKLASAKAEEALKSAESGATQLNETIEAVQAIETSSMEIADIVSLIDEIAFQTNLLALNASVEAARAGEQGKGFSVVATEVRNLAERSANAAREVKELIDSSIDKVKHGTALATGSGESLQEIVNSVKEVAGLIGGIADSTHEQATGIEHISEALSEIDTAVQQNTALVEETAVSSEVMLEQAQQLSKLMNFFKLGNTLETTASTTFQKSTNVQEQNVVSRAVPAFLDTLHEVKESKRKHPTSVEEDGFAYQKTGTDDWDSF